MAKVRIGDRLISAGLITNEQLNQALEEQKRQPRRKKIVRVLVDMGFIEETKLLGFFVELCKRRELNLVSILEDFPNSEENILKLLSRILNMEYVDLDSWEFDPSHCDNIAFSVIERHLGFPISEDENGVVRVVLADPFDIQARDVLSRAIRGKKVAFCIAKKEQIISVIVRLSLHDSVKLLVRKIRDEISGDNAAAIMADDDNQSSITKLVHVIFETAIKNKTSDIHIEGTEKSTLVRIRVDGVMREAFKFDKDLFAPLASRIKLLSNLDIAERRKPQDGRYSDIILGNPYDFRISTLPIITGESIVIRILDKSKVLVRLEDFLNSII